MDILPMSFSVQIRVLISGFENLQVGKFVDINAEFQSAVADNWRRTLDQIPTVIGRVAFMASLRSAAAGSYEHFGLSQRLGAQAASELLRQIHLEVFQSWLCFGLERQKEEIEEYLSSLGPDKREILWNWLHLKPWMAWIPAESREVERTLYDTDINAVLELLRIEYGVASRDPDL
jgi:hypothetical protein